MPNKKNTGSVKPVAKAKPVVKSVHRHSELEQQMSELKKELKQAMVVIDRLSNTSIEMSAKIKVLESLELKDARYDELIKDIKSHHEYTQLRKLYKRTK